MTKQKFRIAVRKFDAFESGLAKIWSSFCSVTGCQMELEAVAMDLHPLYDSILKEKGLANGAWDISLINTDWITEAVSARAIENLSPFVKENPPQGFPEAWSSSLLEAQTFEQNIYALPFHDGPECLIYRRDLFDSQKEKDTFYKVYGKALEVPKTWDDLMEVAEFFHRPERNLYGTTFAAYPDGHNTVFDFCLQLWTRGGELVDENNRIKINAEAALEGMGFYRKALQNKKAIHPGSYDFDSVRSGMAFAKGNIAMMVNWFGFASMCEFWPESNVKGKVDVAQVPSGDNGESVSLIAYWMYVIGSGSEHKELAYEFIKYAVTAENDKLITLEGAIGCRKSTWSDHKVNSLVPYNYKLEELHKNTRILPKRSDWSAIAHVIDQTVLQVINSEKDIKSILDHSQKEIDNIENLASWN